MLLPEHYWSQPVSTNLLSELHQTVSEGSSILPRPLLRHQVQLCIQNVLLHHLWGCCHRWQGWSCCGNHRTRSRGVDQFVRSRQRHFPQWGPAFAEFEFVNAVRNHFQHLSDQQRTKLTAVFSVFIFHASLQPKYFFTPNQQPP